MNATSIIVTYFSFFLMTLGYINHLVWNDPSQNFDGPDGMKHAFCMSVSVLWFIFWPVVVLTSAGVMFNEDEE